MGIAVPEDDVTAAEVLRRAPLGLPIAPSAGPDTVVRHRGVR
ncbi:hypothetical protein ACI78R_18245 [Geodermatophilus sp. SYSU D01106]